MKKAAAMLLICVLLIGSAETALWVNGRPVFCEEAAAFMTLVTDAYRDIADYYENTLNVDYWSLVYTNGMTVWDSVKADAFEQLIMMNLLADMAPMYGLNLTEPEKAACSQSARRYPENGFSRADMEALMQKQLLADKVYSYLLSLTEIDAEAVAASVDPEDYVSYTVEYLCVPYYVYAASDQKKAEVLEQLMEISGFEGPLETLGRYLSPWLTGTMVLSSANSTGDDPLLLCVSGLEPGTTGPVTETDYGLFVLRLLDASDTGIYDEAVEDALHAARAAAFQPEYERLYAAARYELNSDFWIQLKPN